MTRLEEWDVFVAQVRQHLETYAIPQYGDFPDDQVTSWAARDCLHAISRYIARYNRGMRGDAEQQRDFYKMAHYACLAYFKYNEGAK